MRIVKVCFPRRLQRFQVQPFLHGPPYRPPHGARVVCYNTKRNKGGHQYEAWSCNFHSVHGKKDSQNAHTLDDHCWFSSSYEGVLGGLWESHSH